MFSWDNPDVHGMIDRYVKATYLPHLGVKTKPLESSASEISAVIKTRYHVYFSRHAVRHQLEKHRRLIASDVTTPVVSHKRKVREAESPSTSSEPGHSSKAESEEPPAKIPKDDTRFETRRITEQLIRQFMYGGGPFVPRVHHFVPASDSTWKVNPKVLAENMEASGTDFKRNSYPYEDIDYIDPADILPFFKQ
uniref:SAP30_Sin3_bdg domain-containing protein n=1 Tax=Panagrellus redivivus TaxID=6233 RepID=A0A7E4VQ48_PANRE